MEDKGRALAAGKVHSSQSWQELAELESNRDLVAMTLRGGRETG